MGDHTFLVHSHTLHNLIKCSDNDRNHKITYKDISTLGQCGQALHCFQDGQHRSRSQNNVTITQLIIFFALALPSRSSPIFTTTHLYLAKKRLASINMEIH